MKCKEAELDPGVLEQLIAVEMDQQGKLRKRGITEAFNEIFDNIETETDELAERVQRGAKVYTDDNLAYRHLNVVGFEHEAVKHSAREYVRGQAHTNGIESFWSMLKRGYVGTYHYMSEKHLQRYVNEFSGRHNVRDLDTIDQMAGVAAGLVGRRLMYKHLTA